MIEVDALLVDDFESGVVEVEFLEEHEVALLPEDNFGVGLRKDEEGVVVLGLWLRLWLDLLVLLLLDLLWLYLLLLDWLKKHYQYKKI